MTLTRRQIWIAATIATAALAAGGWRWWRGRPVRIQAVIVRPFAGEGSLAEPLRDEIEEDLARVGGLAIVNQPAAPPAATGVLEGRVERSAERIRIVAELSRQDGHHYWGRILDRPIADLPAAAEEIAAAVNPKARRKKPSKYKTAPAAYDAYLDGRYRFDHPDGDGLATAVARLEDATRLDASFAKAWAWLSIAKEYQADRGEVRPNLALPEARDAADRAAALDPDAAEAHLAVGIADLQYDWKWADARNEFDRAAQLSPGWAMARYWRERWDAAMGHGTEPRFHFANLPPIKSADDARKLLEDADDIRVETYISAAALALTANGIHDKENTLRWLDEAYDERCVQLPYILWDPSLPRDDPRFADLVKRMKLDEEPRP